MYQSGFHGFMYVHVTIVLCWFSIAQVMILEKIKHASENVNQLGFLVPPRMPFVKETLEP